MGKIGPYEYPDVGVLTALEVVETIVKEKTEKIETLAAKLGHANANSGGFRAKLAACQRYGFLLGKSTSLNVSSLAKRLVHPKDENERSQLLGQAILNVELFRRIHDKVGISIPSGEFWVTLADIVEAERDEIMADSPKIESIYRDSLPILARYETPSEPGDARAAAVAVSNAQPAQPAEQSMTALGMETLLIVSRKDGLEPRLPRTKASVELARKALDLVDASLTDANSHQ